MVVVIEVGIDIRIEYGAAAEYREHPKGAPGPTYR